MYTHSFRTSTSTALRTSLRCLVHPVTLLSITLLLLNDHLFKVVAPSWLTGKLSDFAGLFFFPFLLAAVLSVALRPLPWLTPMAIGRLALLTTAMWFAAAKATPWGHTLTVQMVSALLGHPVSVVLDPTDLIGLVVLWPSWKLWCQAMAEAHRAFSLRASWPILAVATMATMATSPPPPSVVLDFSIVDTNGNLVPDAGVQVRTKEQFSLSLICQAGKCEIRDSGHGPFTEYIIDISRDGFQPATATVTVPAEKDPWYGWYSPIPQSAEIVLQPVCNADQAVATLTLPIADADQIQVPNASAHYQVVEGEWQQAQCAPSDVAYHCVFDLAGVDLPAELPLRVEASRFEPLELALNVQVGENNCPIFAERSIDLTMASACEASPPILVNLVVESLGTPAYHAKVTYSVDDAPEQPLPCAYEEEMATCSQYRLEPAVPGKYTIYARSGMEHEPVTDEITIPGDEKGCPMVDHFEPIELMIDSVPVLFTDLERYCRVDTTMVSVPVHVMLPDGRSADELHLSYSLGDGEWQAIQECTTAGDETWCYMDLPHPLKAEQVILRAEMAGAAPVTHLLLDPPEGEMADDGSCILKKFSSGSMRGSGTFSVGRTCDICVVFQGSEFFFEVDLTK